MNSKKGRGVLMAAIGGIILLVNTSAYICHWDFGNPYMTAVGIVFLGAGQAVARSN